jgi:hypothetical protein
MEPEGSLPCLQEPTKALHWIRDDRALEVSEIHASLVLPWSRIRPFSCKDCGTARAPEVVGDVNL